MDWPQVSVLVVTSSFLVVSSCGEKWWLVQKITHGPVLGKERGSEKRQVTRQEKTVTNISILFVRPTTKFFVVSTAFLRTITSEWQRNKGTDHLKEKCEWRPDQGLSAHHKKKCIFHFRLCLSSALTMALSSLTVHVCWPAESLVDNWDKCVSSIFNFFICGVYS